MREIIVAGTSIAGFTAAAELRHAGFDDTIRMVGDEPVRTYERPPLSKAVLGGGDETSTAWAAAAGDDLDLDWMLSERAESLDVAGRRLRLGSGDELRFDGLVIATGARPRLLPGQPPLAGLHVMRTLDDSVGLRSDLDGGAERIVVVGAGFIGAEVAATCRRRGHEVTVVEPLEQPLARVLGAELGAVIARAHRDEGVDLRLGVGVEAIEGTDHVERVRLTHGEVIGADVVVVGIGVVPNTEWLEGSGLPVDNGVIADSTCLVADGIVACGDVARWDSPRYGLVRIEHWDNAVEMGRAAGRRLVTSDAEAESYNPVPWFWSDQYDFRIQMAGRPTGEMTISDGAVDDGKFVAIFHQDGQAWGAFGWNWPAKTVRYRMALESGMPWPQPHDT